MRSCPRPVLASVTLTLASRWRCVLSNLIRGIRAVQTVSLTRALEREESYRLELEQARQKPQTRTRT